jgi:transcriptional regulator
MSKNKSTSDRLRGTLDALILTALSGGPLHGYGISRWLAGRSGKALRVEEGTLYPALYRLERLGWIEAEWGTSELGRRARFYRLTPAGTRQLAVEVRTFAEFVAAVSPILLPRSAALGERA